MEKVSGLRQKIRERNRAMPPAREQLASAGNAAAQAARAFACGEQITASAETIAKRKAICEKCENWTGSRCTICGCWTTLKIRLATEACPVGKWPAETVSQKDDDTSDNPKEYPLDL